MADKTVVAISMYSPHMAQQVAAVVKITATCGAAKGHLENQPENSLVLIRSKF
jgi:hypothetical protein